MKKKKKQNKILKRARKDFRILKKEVRDVDRQLAKIENKYEDYV